MIFKSNNRKIQIGDHVREWSYEEIESVFKGKLDYVALCKELGKKPTPKPRKTKSED